MKSIDCFPAIYHGFLRESGVLSAILALGQRDFDDLVKVLNDHWIALANEMTPADENNISVTMIVIETAEYPDYAAVGILNLVQAFAFIGRVFHNKGDIAAARYLLNEQNPKVLLDALLGIQTLDFYDGTLFTIQRRKSKTPTLYEMIYRGNLAVVDVNDEKATELSIWDSWNGH